ncbi:MAG: pyridoxal-phosphate dependent enzyme [Veillonellaceae bacterium]|nr:pyridoxal-phosphate dependent enzyme [Veillonellaceae bacterium]
MTRKEQIRMTLPRLDFGLTPSPLMELSRVSAILGKGRRLFIKRDDLLGVGLGGNKVRRFAYYLGEVVAKGSDVVVAAGGARSNQTIAAAACAAKAGLKAHLVMPESTNATTRRLAEMLGAKVHFTLNGYAATLNRGIRTISDELKAQGHRPYVIRPGAASPLGILGYVDAMRELYAQSEERELSIDHVVCSGGTGTTYAGVLLGTKLFHPQTMATAVAIGRRFRHADTLCRDIRAAAALGGYACTLGAADVHVHFACGQGASCPTVKGREAMQMMATQEGIFLDPLFTGKAFAGLLEMNARGAFQPEATIVFLHTGGMVTLLNSFHA